MKTLPISIRPIYYRGVTGLGPMPMPNPVDRPRFFRVLLSLISLLTTPTTMRVVLMSYPFSADMVLGTTNTFGRADRWMTGTNTYGEIGEVCLMRIFPSRDEIEVAVDLLINKYNNQFLIWLKKYLFFQTITILAALVFP